MFHISNLAGRMLYSRAPALASLHLSFPNLPEQGLFEEVCSHLVPLTILRSPCGCKVCGLSVLRAFHLVVFGFRCYGFGVLWYSPTRESSFSFFLYFSLEASCFGTLQHLSSFLFVRYPDVLCSLFMHICNMQFHSLRAFHRGPSRQIQMRR